MISLMAAIFRFLLFFSVFYTGKAQQQQSNITLNSSLSPSTNSFSWPSPSGRFAFGFYPQGNDFAVGVWLLSGASGNIVVVWTAKRDDPPVPRDAILQLTPNGRLILRSRGQDTPISNTTESASSASMLDTGNFVLYNSKSQIIWQSFDSPTDTILAGQRLRADNQLFSSANENNHTTGGFRLNMQNDGNLVSYPVQTTDTPGNSYWSTSTFTAGNNVTLNLDSNGLLFMLNSTGSNIHNLNPGLNPRNQDTTTVIYRATFDFDGIFRLYSHHFERNGSSTVSSVWSSLSNGCSVNGFCGFNSYCFLLDNRTDCGCPRGYAFVDHSQKFRGCERSFIDECGRTYQIEFMKNTVWIDNPYSVLPLNSEQSCKDACLQDCQCAAALFKDGSCNKQKLPLRFGRRTFDDPTTSLVKFGESSTSPDGTSDPMSPTLDMKRKEDLRVKILIASIALITCLFVVLVFAGVLFYRHRIRRYRFLQETQINGFTGEELAPRPFTYHELEIATDGFKEELGKGAFGTVYRGTLSNGERMIAVKRLDNRVVEDGEKEFQTEMRAIGRTHHRNLVQVLGFCAEGAHRLLVYEYMSNGSLADRLFTAEKRPNWNERVKIAMDIARGILYLHEECEMPIIHCDIKPRNILMDESYCAKISDFGLAKLMKPNQTKTVTGIRGTRGYVAPEWHRNMPITVKADVYSFGIVLLEIVCCRRCVEMEAKEEEKILCHWVYDCFEDGELGKLVDSEEVDKRSLEGIVKVGLWCIQDKPSIRPSMKKVMLMLEGNVEIPIPPSISFLESFNSMEIYQG